MMDEPPSAEPTTEPQTVTVLPGDIVQITVAGHAWSGCLALVIGTPHWGIHVLLLVPDARRPDARGSVQWSGRFRPGEFAVCGAAAVLRPDVASARRDAIETARLVAEEAGR